MKWRTFLCWCGVLLFPYLAQASSNNTSSTPACSVYSECDMIVACELYYEIERADSGFVPDYNMTVANAIRSNPNCVGYADKFLSNIDENVSTNPPIKLTIDWKKVKQLITSPEQDTLIDEDLLLISHIVDVFGPDTEEQKTFFTDLATAYVQADKRDSENSRLDDAFVLDFLGTGTNFDLYKDAVKTLTGETVDTNLGISVNWDDVLDEVAGVLDQYSKTIGLLVCENNRSWQAGIDIAGWTLTAIAAVLTFGAGGAAGVAGRAALGAGLKAVAKGVGKVGGKAAAKSMSKTGGKQLAKTAVKIGMKKDMRGWATYSGKGVLKGATKNYVKIIGKNLSNRKTKLVVAGATLWGISKPIGSNLGAKAYSLVSSKATTDFVNCRDLDSNEGCYTVCGDDNNPGTDDLNRKVFLPILGKTYCVDQETYVLHEIATNDPIAISSTQWDQIQQAIKTKIIDKGNCDGNEDDIDMYIGMYLHDPDTFEIDLEDLVIENILRLDD